MNPIAVIRDGEGPEVLLVHGGASPSTTWGPIAHLRARWTLAFVHRRGYPPSPPPPDGRQDFDLDAADLASLFEARPHVVAHSYEESPLPQTPLVRIAPDGSRAFVPPFGERGSEGAPINVEDEILPLRDGSILFTRSNTIDRLRPDGSIERFAGSGGYSEDPSGDGGPATAAGIGFAHGLSRFPDGSVVFAESERVRRVARNGTITTIAGSGEWGYGGDGGQAKDAKLRSPEGVLPARDGGFLIADTFNGRVRGVNRHGVISTIAGTDKPDIFDSFGDGGPATSAGLALPAHLGRLPDGSLLVGEWQRIRRIAPDGTISTIFDTAQVHGNRLGDFAGRYGDTIEAMEVTREGGVAVIVAGVQLRALYLAPRRTRRTLVALHGARVSERRVEATVDTTTSGLLRLEVRRRGKLVAHASRRVRAGRNIIGVGGRFAAALHDVHVDLSADRGGGYDDRIDLFTSGTLPKRLVSVGVNSRCQRIGRRRIDCEVHDEEDEEDGVPCLYTVAFRLFRSGLVFTRQYGPACHSEPRAFHRTPDWTGPWRAVPPE